jgi:hypothetical protein
MEKVGPVIQKLYDTLTGIQAGRSSLRKAGSSRSADRDLTGGPYGSADQYLTGQAVEICF